jgi:hypothetical protein
MASSNMEGFIGIARRKDAIFFLEGDCDERPDCLRIPGQPEHDSGPKANTILG